MESEQQGNEILDLTPDFSEALDFSKFPDGTYLARLVDVKGFQAKTGTMMVRFIWEIVDDKVYQNEFGETLNIKGRKVFRNTPARGPGAGFLKSVLREGLGYDPNEFRLPSSRLELAGRMTYLGTKYDPEGKMNKPDTWKYAGL